MVRHFLWNIMTTIKNNQIINKSYIIIRKKKKLLQLLNILWDENYISGYTIINDKFIKIFLKYVNNKPLISNLKFISRPGKQFYLSSRQLWKLKLKSNCLILSTDKGFLTMTSCKKYQIGGKPLILLF